MSTRGEWKSGPDLQGFGKAILMELQVLHILPTAYLSPPAPPTLRFESGMRRREQQWVSLCVGIPIGLTTSHTLPVANISFRARGTKRFAFGMQRRVLQWVSL